MPFAVDLPRSTAPTPRALPLALLLTLFAATAQASAQTQPSPFGTGVPDGQTSQSAPPTQASPLPTTTASPTQLGPRVLNGRTDTQDDFNSPSDRNRRQQELLSADAPVPLTGFQRLVALSVGQVLPIYGARLFNDVPSTFAPVDRIPVTPDYVVGPGDELLVRLWGQLSFDGHLTVDRTGDIYIPQVGAVRVAGLPFARLTDSLRKQIGRTFKNFDLNVNMGQLRSIQVFVVGDARRPGSYTVGSLSTLVNALFATGGPSPTGSLRRIQVKRGTETVTTFDFYDLLLKGDKTKDVPLLSGDVIYIPPAGPMVALAGNVETPALFEIAPGTTVHDVLSLAGGLSTLAQTRQLRIERLARRSADLKEDARSVLDVALDPTGLATPLMDGDILEVSPIVDRFQNTVTLRGNVAEPRRFAWHPGMRVRDLIPQKEALLTRQYWEQHNQLGMPALDATPEVRRYAPAAPIGQINGNGLAPTPRDPTTLTAPSARDSDRNIFGVETPPPTTTDTSDAAAGARNQGSGAVQSASEIATSGATRVYRNSVLASSDAATDLINGNNAAGASVSTAVTASARRFPPRNAVILSAPDIDWAYAVVQRLNPQDLSTRLLSFNLGRAILDGDETQNLLLESGDVITIFSKADIRVPQAQQSKFVRLEGEFAASGTYSVAPGETLRQLVARSGGLTPAAYLYGSQFSRESARVLQQQRLNDYAADLDRRIRLAEANSANTAMSPQDLVADINTLQNARTIAMRLRQLTASGRIVLDIHPDSRSLADIPDLPLEDGDTFIVPQAPTSVEVFGAVYTQTSFLFDPHKRAGDYIRQAGGGTRTADTRRAYIVRADGSIVSRQFSSSPFVTGFPALHMNPGDAVIVPEQVDKRPFLRNLVDVATIVGQFGLGIAAINVLK